MRVSSGKYKGRPLLDNPFEHIRPTADVVKQSIFNKLCENIIGAKVLDLFCGTGALGIEAVSRGASEVVFADKDFRSVELTKKNIKKLGITENIRVIKSDYQNTLKLLKDEKFDLIILDPPYKSGIYEDVVKQIYELGLLAEDGIIICEHDKKDRFDFSLFKTIDEKIYGIKMVTYLTY